VTHSPELGAGATLVVVTVAALAFGLLKDITYLLHFKNWVSSVVLPKCHSWFDKLTTNGNSISPVHPEPVEGQFTLSKDINYLLFKLPKNP